MAKDRVLYTLRVMAMPGEHTGDKCVICCRKFLLYAPNWAASTTSCIITTPRTKSPSTVVHDHGHARDMTMAMPGTWPWPPQDMTTATPGTWPWPCQGHGHGYARDMAMATPGHDHGHARDMAMAMTGTWPWPRQGHDHGHARDMTMATPGT